MNNNGKQGEQLFEQKMLAKGHKVISVANNPDYWNKDIDFIVTSGNTGAVKTFEVKWDTRISRTGNLYLEFANANSQGCKGWWEFCEADYLAYGNANGNTFLIFSMEALRERVEKLPKVVAFCEESSAGYLVHISQVKDLFTTL